MKKHSLLLALALFFGAKAFAQEWEWDYQVDPQSGGGVYEAMELSDGNIMALGYRNHVDSAGLACNFMPCPIMWKLDSGGNELAFSEYHKDGYYGFPPYVLENGSGDVYALMTYSPDHDTCSSNYFKNFEPVTDHCILGLYRLNDDLTIAESHEVEIPIDTSEWRSEENGFFSWVCGQAHLYSAFVDDDGTIVGVYDKTVSQDREKPHGYDSTVFFRMNFEGNVLARAAYCGKKRSGASPAYNFRRHHIVKADSLYLYYGTRWDVKEEENINLAYLDYDFNIVRCRAFKQADQVQAVDNMNFMDFNAIRSNRGTTLLTNTFSARTERYCVALYEYNDDVNGYGNNTPILHYAKRKTGGWDFATTFSPPIQLEDNSLLYAYSLNVGAPPYYTDSRIVIEHLSAGFESLSMVYYGTYDDNQGQAAYGIASTHDGGMLLTLCTKELYNENQVITIAKFPAEAFLGVEEAHTNGLKVAIAYPNPGGSEMHIRTAVENAAVEVYDMNGRLVAQQPVTETETVLDATDWAAGTYVWKVISTGKDVESGKWVKE